MKDKAFRKLPTVFQTDTQRQFFQATFEQLFSKKDVESISGYIGRRVPGRYDPINDYFLAEPSKERTWYQLESTSYSVDQNTLDKTNVMFYQDLLNKIQYNGANISNHDRLFSGEYYSFCPPIDLDKFINFQNYFWIEGKLPVLDLTVTGAYDEIDADRIIENTIIGKETASFTYVGTTYPYTNGIRVRFTNSKDYKKNYTVEGVGKAIVLVPDVNTLSDGAQGIDYVTIERGCVDANQWSVNNKWYHKATVALVSSILNISGFSNTHQARRPIIEFERDIALFNSGTKFVDTVDFAAIDYNDLVSDGIVDGVVAKNDDKLIFLNDSSQIEYPIKETFVAGVAPYSYKLIKPFDDQDEKFVIVKRGSSVFYNPDWYSYEDQVNTFYFKSSTKGLDWDVKTVDEFGNNFAPVTGGTYTFVTPTVSANIVNIDVYERNGAVRYDRTKFTYDVQRLSTPIGKNKSRVTVTFTDTPPYPVELRINDDMVGLAKDDVVEVNINNRIVKHQKTASQAVESAGSRKTFIFDKNDFNFEVNSGTITAHTIGVKLKNWQRDVNNDPIDYDYVFGTSDDFLQLELNEDNDIIITFKDVIPDDSIVEFYTRNDEELVLYKNSFIWKVDIRDNNDVNIIPAVSKYKQVSEGDIVLVTDGLTRKGHRYYYTNGKWKRTVNQKLTPNQAPLFDLFYTELNNGVPKSLSEFPGSTFAGNKIFSYKVNEESAFDDEILGFPIEYANLGQIADILFVHNLYVDKYYYSNNGTIQEIKGYHYFKNNNYDPVTKVASPSYDHTWVPFKGTSKQRIVDRFVVSDTSVTSYTLSTEPSKRTDDLYDIIVYHEKKTLVQGSDYTITNGTSLNLNVSLALNDVVESHLYKKADGLPELSGYFEIPQQLEKNPNNLEVTTYTSNELTNQFVSIMTNQLGFVGDPFSSNNNYRDTAEDKSLGTYILQNRNPLLKTMLVSSENNIDVVEAIRFAKDEYVRYKDKIVKYTKDLIAEGFTPDPANSIDTDSWFSEVITRVSNSIDFNGGFANTFMLGFGEVYTERRFNLPSSNTLIVDLNYDPFDEHNIVYVFERRSSNSKLLVIDVDYKIEFVDSKIRITLLGSGFASKNYVVRAYNGGLTPKVPATPAKLGCAKVYKPEIVIDDSYATPTQVIIGHDGSKTPVYGNKIDDILLEFELRIYNNINSDFKNEYDMLLTHDDVVPGFFRNTDYEINEINAILEKSFLRWKSKYGLNFKDNFTYSPTNWKTWNYNAPGTMGFGSWKSIYKFYFDSIRPHQAPWEMLGFNTKPTWWDTEYTIDYTSGNIQMWLDIQNGVIRKGERAGIDQRYVRPNLIVNGLVPVDAQGNLRTVTDIFPSILNYMTTETMSDSWEFGDQSPVESAWRDSSEFPYVVMELLYLTKPATFGETFWNPADIIKAPINENHYVSKETYTRKGNSENIVHGEVVDGVVVYRPGYQQLISDRLTFFGANVSTAFGDKVRSLDVCLGHRFAGYTNSNTLKLYAESSSTDSTNTSLLIPSENVNISLYTGKPIKEYVYSGVAIRVLEDGRFEVRGYDILIPKFKFYGRDKFAESSQLVIGATSSNFTMFQTGQSYAIGDIVKYNTVFYECIVAHDAKAFDDKKWLKLSKLPSKGGVTVSYNSHVDYNSLYEIDYGYVFDSIQEVFDFLIGYGDYLKTQGWVFDNIDTDLNEIQDWLLVAKGFLFWVNTNWAPNNTLFVSAGSTKIVLEVNEGYPDKIERLSNGVYSILEQNGYAIQPPNTKVNRYDRRVEISHVNNSVGIYSVRVTTSETEHIALLDNRTVFNDIIYDPLLYSRQKRLRITGFRSRNWTGKYEADGYIISGNALLPNFDNLVDSIQYYYDTEDTLDNPVVEQTAQHLIGFQNRDYLDNLQLTGDQQYLFYKGVIPQKGTIQTVDKLLRSEFIKSNENIRIFEEMAFRVGDFGSVSDNAVIEIKIDGNLLKTDPQLVKIDYPESYNTGYIHDVVVLSAEYAYTSRPTITVTPPEGYVVLDAAARLTGQTQIEVNGIPVRPAQLEAVIDNNGKITSVTILDEGYGYKTAPAISVIVDGVATNDILMPVMRNLISVDNPYDLAIAVDIDDTDTVIHKPAGRGAVLIDGVLSPGLDFVPMTEYLETRYPLSGYVHMMDVTHTSFTTDNLWELWTSNRYVKPIVGSFIWIGNLSNYGKNWGVFELQQGALSDNDIPGFAVFNNVLYKYTLDQFGVIDKLTDKDGNEVSNINTTSPVVFVNCRVKTLSNVKPNHNRVWIDLYSNNKWAVADRVNGQMTVFRKEDRYVNSNFFKNAYFYDNDTKDTIVMLPVYDPVKGLIPGIADQNLTYKTDVDPARYTNSKYVELIADDTFGEEQVGQLWWDLSVCRFINYEQPARIDATDAEIIENLEYRKNRWGQMFPGSVVHVYEWVKSTTPPSQYTDGIPKSVDDYVVVQDIDSRSGIATTVYYFWARSVTSRPTNIARRTMSAFNVEKLLSNPKSYGFEWFAFVSEYSFVFANINKQLNNRTTVFQANFRYTRDDQPKHTEWKLLRENDEKSIIPSRFWNKLVDSVVGYDSNNNVVPDLRLNDRTRYGTSYRPRQTWFIDKYEARRILVEHLNKSLLDIPMKDDREKWSNLVSNTTLWHYVDWYATGYNSTTSKPTRQVYSVGELEALTNLVNGDIVKLVISDTDYNIYRYDATIDNYTLIGRPNCAVQLNTDFATVKRSYTNDMALRNILTVLSDYVFTDEYLVKKNQFFFAMVNYVLSEQNKVDWIFKTTYVKINQDGEALTQKDFYTKDPINSFSDYVQEVKPYTTKIRDLGVNYKSPLETAKGIVYDFDSLYDWPSKHNGAPAPFDPFDVPRKISIHSLYDRVQCGYTGKLVHIDVGFQTVLILDSGLTSITLNTSDDLFTSDGEETEFLLSNGKDTDRIKGVTLDGTLLEQSSYTVISRLNRKFIKFNNAPGLGQLRVMYSDLKSCERITLNGRILPSNLYSLNRDFDGYLKITFVNDEILKYNDKLKVYAGVDFLHTGVEEMRLEYNARKPGQIINPVFDLALDTNSHIAQGWGVSLWDTVGWGDASGRREADTTLWKEFIMYSGATGRFILYQKDLHRYIKQVAPTNSVFYYSDYSERTLETDQGERGILEQFNVRFSDTYNCDYEGALIDGKDFTYIPSTPWDRVPWDSDKWDKTLITSVVTPTLDSNTDSFISSGQDTFVINQNVDVTKVAVDGNEISGYSVSISGNNTTVTTPTSVSSGTIVDITYNYVSDEFDNDPSLEIVDSGDFVDPLYSEGISEENVPTKITENIVMTVDTNTNFGIVKVVADGTSNSYDIGVKVVPFKIESVKVNGTAVEYFIDNTNETTHVILKNPASTNDEVVILFKRNFLTQTYTADDNTWDANTVSRDIFGKYIQTDLTTLRTVSDIGKWGTTLWGAEGLGGDEALPYRSSYMLPVLVPQTVKEEEIIISVVSTSNTYYDTEVILGDGSTKDFDMGSNINDKNIISVDVDGTLVPFNITNESGTYVLHLENAPAASTYVTVQYLPYTIMSFDEFVLEQYTQYTEDTQNYTLEDYTLDRIEMAKASYRQYISDFYSMITTKSTKFRYSGSTRKFTVSASKVDFLNIDVYVNDIKRLMDRDYVLGISVVDADTINVTVEYRGQLSTGDVITLSVNETDEAQVTEIIKTSSIVQFTAKHDYITLEDGSGDYVVVEYQLKPVSFKMHFNDIGTVDYIRNSDYFSSTLVKPLKENDRVIEVADASKFVPATATTPGVVWIGTERIEYTGKRANKLVGVTRCTRGTSYRVYNNNTVIPAGTVVFDGSDQQTRDVGTEVWVNNNGGISLSNTKWSLFLQERPGSALPYNKS